MANRKKPESQEGSVDGAAPLEQDGQAAPKKPAASGRKKAPAASATAKAKTAAKKVAAAVNDTVREIAEKVTRKAAPRTTKASTKKTATASASKHANSDSEEPVLKKTTKATSRRTKTAALAEGTTSEDVRETMLDLSNSEDVPAEATDHVGAATDVREHFLDAQPQGPPPPQPPRDLPDEYGDTKVVLLVRDPEWVYAYWEVNDTSRAQVDFPRNGNSRQRLVLRLYKITETPWPMDQAHYFFDVEVPSEAQNWYIHLPEVNQQWCAELGLVDSEDNFTAICRSNAIATPRNSISDRVDSDWMTVEESFEKITRLSRAGMEAQLQGAGAAGSEAILRTINRQLTAVLHGEKAALSSGIFSSEAGIPDRSKDFWLQVHTELILYGATEPDAKVTVQGRPVELNPDGTFSMRFALPDGMQVLEVRAVNRDGDLDEEITPVVERTTR